MIHEANLNKPSRAKRLALAGGLTGLTALVIGVGLLWRDRPPQPEVLNLVQLVESDSSAFVADDPEEFVRTVETQLDRLHRIVDEVAPHAESDDVDALRELHVEIATRLLELRIGTEGDWSELRDDVLEDLEMMSTEAVELVGEVS